MGRSVINAMLTKWGISSEIRYIYHEKEIENEIETFNNITDKKAKKSLQRGFNDWYFSSYLLLTDIDG